MTIIAAADGSALGNPGPAGWAWYIDDDRWHAGGWAHGTNNMGELKAVLDLLEATADVREPLKVLCDSQYVINSITKWMPGWKKKGWKKADGKPVGNVELMKALDTAMKGRDVSFEWVKGHAGHEMNEAADARANAAARAFQAGAPVDAGPGLGTHDPDPYDPAEEARDQDPDLLVALGAQEESLARGSTPEQEVLGMETHRLRHGLPAAQVHPGAVLIGADGRPVEPDRLDQGDADADIHVVDVLPLGRNAVLVSTHVVGGREGSAVTVHAALWAREDSRNELGDWLLRHHQVTAEA
ncbi:ribonuclease HI [Kocuria coralli]|uniref:Ribonuclease H n=1 Tax=Kocuria coralli TaxID=1461025 RepID=A0A5J5KZ82_9MICC|nr:ribonuclease H [Kocuria coralli]KAA9394718.1 ribonuclease HI [Kocuria coralli]